MLDLGIGIRAWARVDPAEVDERHLDVFGRGFRRIGSYVKLGQVGAQACLAAAAPPPGARVGVFLGTGLGNTEISVPLAEGILHAVRPWCSPMAFAGSVGNAASFYVARSLGVDGPNATVSQEELSFEAALLEAVLALREGGGNDGGIDYALVGGVDVREVGREGEHRARLDAEGLDGTPAAGSGWLLLGRGDAPVRLDEVWMGRVGAGPEGIDRLLDGVPAGSVVLPGWRLANTLDPSATDRGRPDRGLTVAPAERRLLAVAAAVRLVEVLDGTEPIARPSTGPCAVAHIHRTARGTGARVRLSLP